MSFERINISFYLTSAEDIADYLESIHDFREITLMIDPDPDWRHKDMLALVHDGTILGGKRRGEWKVPDHSFNDGSIYITGINIDIDNQMLLVQASAPRGLEGKGKGKRKDDATLREKMSVLYINY